MPRGEKQINPFYDPLEIACPDPSAAKLSSAEVAAMAAKYKVAAELADVGTVLEGFSSLNGIFASESADTAAIEAVMRAIDPLP